MDKNQETSLLFWFYRLSLLLSPANAALFSPSFSVSTVLPWCTVLSTHTPCFPLSLSFAVIIPYPYTQIFFTTLLRFQCFQSQIFLRRFFYGFPCIPRSSYTSLSLLFPRDFGSLLMLYFSFLCWVYNYIDLDLFSPSIYGDVAVVAFSVLPSHRAWFIDYLPLSKNSKSTFPRDVFVAFLFCNFFVLAVAR